MKSHSMKRLLGAAVASLMLAVPGQAQTVVKFGTAHPPGNAVAEEFHAWAERVNAELTEARIEMIDAPAVAGLGQILDRIDQGVIDIGFELQSYYPGKFEKTSVSGLPNMFEDAPTGSVALWDLYESGEIADEYDGYVILGLYMFPNADLMTVEPITPDNTIAGRKLASTSASRDQTTEALGGSPVSIKIAEWYQAAQRGIIDGMVQSTSAVPPFSLQEVVKNVLKFPLGGNAAMVVMSKEKFDALPDSAKEIIMKHSGREFSRRLGAHTEELATRGAQTVTDAGGEVRQATPEEAETYAAAAEKVSDSWIASHPESEALIARYRELVEKAAAE